MIRDSETMRLDVRSRNMPASFWSRTLGPGACLMR